MTKENNISFEEAMESLEKIVQKLETGDVPLEKAITFYQEGMGLAKVCHQKLTAVQDQMTTILNEHGELDPFDVQEASNNGSNT